MRLNHTSAVHHVTRPSNQPRRRQRDNIVDRSVDSTNCMSSFVLLLLLLLLLRQLRPVTSLGRAMGEGLSGRGSGPPRVTL